MVKLKADFESDWIAQLKTHMTRKWGAPVEDIENRYIASHYFDSLHRRLASQPRALKIADDFRSPPETEAGWKALQDKVGKGEDLNPHLSLGHASLFNLDGLLAEWGVHHFHLGTKPHPTNPYYVNRTDLLVFALVDDNTFCAINVYRHKNHWEEVGIIESIHRSWPDLIRAYRVNGVPGEMLNERQRRTVRKQNINVAVSTTDGTVYCPIRGPASASGIKIESTRRADRWRNEIHGLQASLENQLSELIPTFAQQGYAGEGEIEAELRFTDTGYHAYFPKFRVIAKLLGVKSRPPKLC